MAQLRVRRYEIDAAGESEGANQRRGLDRQIATRIANLVAAQLYE